MMADNQKHITKLLKRFAPLGILAALMALVFTTGLHNQFSLEAFHAHKDALQNYAAAHPVLSAGGFVGAYMLAVALSLPVATLLTLAGGFLFGKWLGTLYVVIAATIGATIIFAIAKSSLGLTLREKAGALYKKVESNMSDNAVGYLLFMRLVPLFPFVLVNIVPALFNVPLRVFVLTTFFGIIPGSFVFVNVGEQLGTIETLSDLVSTETLVAFGLLGFFALIPTLYKQWKAKKTVTTAAIIVLLALPAAGAHANTYEQFTALYDGLLFDHIAPATKEDITFNGVDYAAWAEDARHEKAKEILLQTDPAQFKSNTETMAFWINTYNFLTVDLIIKEKETESIKNLGGLFSSPWKKHKWKISGKSYSLDHIEHDILRPMMDPRIHFAINCASISCPDLRVDAYRPGALDAQLNEQVNLTFANPTKGLSHNEDTVVVSRIFHWFSEDFNNGDIKGWLAEYEDISEEKMVEYQPYNWALNSQ